MTRATVRGLSKDALRISLTVQLISAAIAAGLAGVVVNTAKGGDGMAAHWLFTVFTALCAAGVAVSYGATRARQGQPVG
ncbi:hypothetical protein A5695_10895 [Mycobacterium sp. E1747]|nr:hypothetical protein A5695_10895 [Mycobacterium sp. E1747]